MLSGDDELEEAELVFREQADGRKVSRLPNGKVVLIDLAELDRVKDGERWKIRLDQKETFAIAHAIERLEANAAAAFVPAPRMNYAPPRAPPRRNPTQIVMPAPPPSLRPAEPAKPVTVADLQAVPSTAVASSVTQVGPANVILPTDRVAMFIDGANTDGASREAGYFIDFAKAKSFASSLPSTTAAPGRTTSSRRRSVARGRGGEMAVPAPPPTSRSSQTPTSSTKTRRTSP